jgi:hypothetical protein
MMCTECNQKPQFARELCQPCYDRKRYLADPEKFRAEGRDRYWAKADRQLYNQRANLWRNYRLTIDGYLDLLEQQDGVCAICGGVNTDGRRLYVDHDHGCCPTSSSCGQCVRGLLCYRCNSGLSFFREDEAVVEKALDYMRKQR